jgi:hypothetical protein
MEIDDLLKKNTNSEIVSEQVYKDNVSVEQIQTDNDEYKKLQNIYLQNVTILENIKNIVILSNKAKMLIEKKTIDISKHINDIYLEMNNINTSFEYITNNIIPHI